METKLILEQHLIEIEKWERDQKGLFFWEKLGRLPFKSLYTEIYSRENWDHDFGIREVCTKWRALFGE